MTTDVPVPGLAETVAPDVARVLCPNPSPMTYWGTNTYLVGSDSLAIIDPGPRNDTHLAALIDAINGRPVSHILITHSHLDHSPLAPVLSDAVKAPVCAFGPSGAGRSMIMQELAETGLLGGGEGVDADFTPDVLLSDGDVVESDGWALTARHTPGHFGNHLSFLMGDVALTGDHLMGWATSLVSPPDGDLTDFMASCAKLSQTTMVRALPGHGAPIEDAQTRLADLIAHRKGREAGVRQHLSQVGPSTVAEISSALYTDTPTPLLPMAQRNVLAHLIDLTNRGIARPDDALSADATFRLS